MKFPELEVFIKALLMGTRAVVCFQDMSGLTQQPFFNLPQPLQMHACSYCDGAKTTRKGLQLCLECKRLATERALREKQPFEGFCAMGAYEMVYPVVINGKVAAILYLGNLEADREKMQERMTRACRVTGVQPDKMLELGDTMEPAEELAPYREMLRCLAAYVVLAAEKQGAERQREEKQRAGKQPLEKQSPGRPEPMHWVIRQMLQYMQHYYSADLTLAKLASMYRANEQYAGRLFREQVGVPFHDYLNRVRLEAACRMLQETEWGVAQIAYEVGYNHVTYFNRMFRRRYGCTPGELRKGKTGKTESF